MSLIECFECNNMISDKASVCPYCGISLQKFDIKGTVKIDKSKELNNWVVLAHRAKDEMNAEEGAKYYQLIANEDPTNVEASFYAVYFVSMQTTAQNAKVDIVNLKKRTLSTLTSIKELNREADMQDFINELGEKIVYFCGVKYTHLQREMDPIFNRANTLYFKQKVELLQHLAYATGDKIEELFGKSRFSNTICNIFKNGVNTYNRMTYDCNSLPVSVTKELKKTAKLYVDKIKTYDRSYKSPIKWYM